MRPGTTDGTATWIDFDGDDDLDVLLTGATDSGNVTNLYRNEGGGLLSDVLTMLPGVTQSAVAWDDYDRDGDPDLLLTGHSYDGPMARIYRNEGDGAFVDAGSGLVGIESGAVAWGDYDDDGDPDLVLSGNEGDRVATRIYRNEGDGVFVDVGSELPGTSHGAVAWADFDRDGDLDLLLTGLTEPGRRRAHLPQRRRRSIHRYRRGSDPRLERFGVVVRPRRRRRPRRPAFRRCGLRADLHGVPERRRHLHPSRRD